MRVDREFAGPAQAADLISGPHAGGSKLAVSERGRFQAIQSQARPETVKGRLPNRREGRFRNKADDLRRKAMARRPRPKSVTYVLDAKKFVQSRYQLKGHDALCVRLIDAGIDAYFAQEELTRALHGLSPTQVRNAVYAL